MTTKHTPGPWHVREGKYGNVLVEYDTRGEGTFNNTWVLAMLDAQQYEERFMPAGSQLANARLIAAAPDMLEALEAFVAATSSDFDALVVAKLKALAIIKKAKGE